jgi:WD40 repeat protein
MFFVSSCAGSSHAFADRSIDLFLQLGHSGSVSPAVFSPHGTWLASSGEDCTVKPRAVGSGILLRTFSRHTTMVRSVGFSLDGERLASGSFDSSINIWDARSGAIMVSMALLPGHAWIAYNLQKLVRNSSLQGDEPAAIRFDHQLSLVYLCDNPGRG